MPRPCVRRKLAYREKVRCVLSIENQYGCSSDPPAPRRLARNGAGNWQVLGRKGSKNTSVGEESHSWKTKHVCIFGIKPAIRHQIIL